MVDARNKPVRIAAGNERATLTRAQKAFNDLIARIGKQRGRMVAWETAIARYHKKYTGEWLPAVRTLTDLRIELLRRLDEASFDTDLTKSERRILAELILEMTKELLYEREDNAELKALYNRHTGSDYDTDKAAAAERRNARLEETFGIDAGSLDDVMKEAEAELERSKRAAEISDEEHERAEAYARRKLSPKQRALEEQREADALHASQSIRDVYRKLASALHPDRETDPAERARKTALMQRVNQAYANDDLLQLFELQLELEHIDRTALRSFSEERLEHYNRVLADQLRELGAEISRVENEFRDRFGLASSLRLAPKTILRHLRDDIADIEQSIDLLREDLRAIGNVGEMKRWIARMRRMRGTPGYDDAPI